MLHILYFPGKYLFDVSMTVTCMIKMTGELTALKSVFITATLNSSCEMLGSRENSMNNFLSHF